MSTTDLAFSGLGYRDTLILAPGFGGDITLSYCFRCLFVVFFHVGYAVPV
jgi:hypothetical protein